MVDLVGTCPKHFWPDWIAEGDAAGEPETGNEYGWYTAHFRAAMIAPGNRFYVVAHGLLRGWAPVTRVGRDADGGYVICRRGGAVACTIGQPIAGFRGLRTRWWPREWERPFPDWRTKNVDRATLKRMAHDLHRSDHLSLQHELNPLEAG